MDSKLLLHHLPLYLLVDPYLGDYPAHGFDLTQCDTFDQLEKIRAEAWEHPVYIPKGLDPKVDVYRLPYVVDLTNATNDDLSRIRQEAISEQLHIRNGDVSIGCRIGALIETWMSPADLIRRLESMWQLRIGSPPTRYLRIADRRVFEGLIHLVSKGELAQFLGPIAYWHFFSRARNWECAHGACAADPEWYESVPADSYRQQLNSARIFKAASLVLAVEQYKLLLDFEGVSRALLDLERRDRPINADAYQSAWKGAVEARKLGLEEPQDIGAFIVRWMIDPSCVSTTIIQEALKRFCNNDESFANSIAELELDDDTPLQTT